MIVFVAVIEEYCEGELVAEYTKKFGSQQEAEEYCANRSGVDSPCYYMPCDNGWKDDI